MPIQDITGLNSDFCLCRQQGALFLAVRKVSSMVPLVYEGSILYLSNCVSKKFSNSVEWGAGKSNQSMPLDAVKAVNMRCKRTKSSVNLKSILNRCTGTLPLLLPLPLLLSLPLFCRRSCFFRCRSAFCWMLLVLALSLWCCYLLLLLSIRVRKQSIHESQEWIF